MHSLKHWSYNSRFMGQIPTSLALYCSKYVSSFSPSFFTSILVDGLLDNFWRHVLPSFVHSLGGNIIFNTSLQHSPSIALSPSALSSILSTQLSYTINGLVKSILFGSVYNRIRQYQNISILLQADLWFVEFILKETEIQ